MCSKLRDEDNFSSFVVFFVASLRTNLLIMSHEWSQLGLCFHFTFVPCTATPPCMIQFAGRGFLIMSCQLKQCIVLSPIHSGTLMATIDPESDHFSSLYPHPDWLIILYPKVFRILKHCAGLHDYYAASSHDGVGVQQNAFLWPLLLP